MTAGRSTLAAFVLLLATALLSLAASAQQAAQNPRIALVIGNATYRDAALATTANDAGLVAQTLQAAGFDVVGARDLDGQSLRTAFRDFLDKAAAAGPDMQAFVYLAGRGVQYNGDNYFVPIDAQINRDADVPIDALRITDFAHALAQTSGKARIIVLDAARANPYASQGSPLAPGLALVDPEPGELIAFNAAPGTLAGDEQGPYGVFGKTLAGAMRQGGVDVVEVFDQTSDGQPADAGRASSLERVEADRALLHLRTRRGCAASRGRHRCDQPADRRPSCRRCLRGGAAA